MITQKTHNPNSFWFPDDRIAFKDMLNGDYSKLDDEYIDAPTQRF